jgi:hypothetical protein
LRRYASGALDAFLGGAGSEKNALRCPKDHAMLRWKAVADERPW